MKGGPQAVTVEGVAARVGASKGSGYWHFASRADLLTSVIQQWRVEHTERLMLAAGAEPSPEGALGRLFHLIFEDRTGSGEGRILASDDPAVAPIAGQIAQERIGFVARLVEECGIPADIALRRAELAYCTVVGHEVLLAAARQSLSAKAGEGTSRADAIVAALLAPTPEASKTTGS